MSFEQSLKGGHPNSLGNTLEVVDAVLGNTDKMEDLFLCYQSNDETVRLRTSNAFKRIFRAKPELFNKFNRVIGIKNARIVIDSNTLNISKLEISKLYM